MKYIFNRCVICLIRTYFDGILGIVLKCENSMLPKANIEHHKDVVAYNKHRKTEQVYGFKGFIEEKGNNSQTGDDQMMGHVVTYLFQDLGSESLKRFDEEILEGLQDRLNLFAHATQTCKYTYDREKLNEPNLLKLHHKDSIPSDGNPVFTQPLSWQNIDAKSAKNPNAINLINASLISIETETTPKLPFNQYNKLIHLPDACLTDSRLVKKENGKLEYVKENGFTSYNQIFENAELNDSVALADICRLTSFTGTTDKIHETYNGMKVQGYSTKRPHRLAYEKTNALWAQKAIIDYGHELYQKVEPQAFIDNSLKFTISQLDFSTTTDHHLSNKITRLIETKIFNEVTGPKSNDIQIFKAHLMNSDIGNNILLDTVKKLTEKISSDNPHYLLYSLYISIMHNEVLQKTKSPPQELKNLCKLLSPHHDLLPELRKNFGRQLDKNTPLSSDYRSIFRDNSAIRTDDKISHKGLVHEYWRVIFEKYELKDVLAHDKKFIPLEFLPINTILMLESRAKTTAKLFIWELIQDLRNDNENEVPSNWKEVIENLLEPGLNDADENKLIETILACEERVTPQKNDILTFDNSTSSVEAVLNTLNRHGQQNYLHYCHNIFNRDESKNPITRLLSLAWGTIVNTLSVFEPKNPIKSEEIKGFVDNMCINTGFDGDENTPIDDVKFETIQSLYLN